MKNNKYYRVYAEINLDAIVKNVDNLMALTKENTGALAVVKADGYGHGDVAVAKAVAQKVTGYAVATLDEAVNLRENGVKKPILVLGYVDPYLMWKRHNYLQMLQGCRKNRHTAISKLIPVCEESDWNRMRMVLPL